jgi:hypothetical protein
LKKKSISIVELCFSAMNAAQEERNLHWDKDATPGWIIDDKSFHNPKGLASSPL